MAWGRLSNRKLSGRGLSEGLTLDPYWSSNVLLMTAEDGLLDKMGHPITVSNAIASTSEAQAGSKSIYFNGASYCKVATTGSDYALATDDFTIEFWIKCLTAQSDKFIMGFRAQGGSVGLSITTGGYGGTTVGALRVAYDGTGASVLTSTSRLDTGSWVHCALVRRSGTLMAFINGILESTVYNTNLTINAATNRPILGANDNNETNNYLTGYMDGIRITKGVARYTRNFVPPSSTFRDEGVLSADPYWNYTVLAARLDGAFGGGLTDLKGKTLTANGNAAILPSRLMGSAYGYFDGNSSLAISDSADFTFGTGDFTVEAWAQVAKLPSSGNGYAIFSSASGLTLPGTFFIADTGALAVWNNGLVGNTGNPIPLGRWVHVAFSRVSGTLHAFIDGIKQWSVAHTANYAESKGLVGKNPGASSGYFKGFIDDIRVTKGVGRYVANFDPPAAISASDPYWANVALALPMDGAQNSTVFTDLKGKTVTLSGVARQVSPLSLFGRSSCCFNGNADYLTIPTSTDWQFGTGDFSIDLWAYIAADSSPDGSNTRSASLMANYYNGAVFSSGFSLTISGNSTTTGTGIEFNYSNGTAWVGYTGTLSAPVSKNQWHHIALTRENGTMRIFLDGAVIQTTANAVNIAGGNTLYLGGLQPDPSYARYLNGFLSQVRITKGYARWTSSFTPPNAPF